MTEVGNESLQGVEGTTELESAHEKTPEQIQHEHEKQAFETHINTSDEAVPDNFTDAGAWFDSLKEAQKQYTQSRQEISELKDQLEAPVMQVDDDFKDDLPLTNELRIPDIEEDDIAAEGAPTGVDEATYDAWSAEFAVNGGFSEQTRTEIKSKTGFSDKMLNDYVEAQKARLRESYGKAANIVGGQASLDKIFKWAAKNLTPNDMQDVNLGLASSSYEITLRGLKSMYDSAVQTERKKEPEHNPNLTQVAASQTGILPYKNQREFKQERNDPQFQVEPRYREMVQQRMAMTDWNTLPV